MPFMMPAKEIKTNALLRMHYVHHSAASGKLMVLVNICVPYFVE